MIPISNAADYFRDISGAKPERSLKHKKGCPRSRSHALFPALTRHEHI
jgi:hypothetical protein